MKYILTFILLCLLSAPAMATPITDKQAQVFYNSCVTKPDPSLASRLLPGSLEAFCKCNAQHLQQGMSFEDVQGYVKNERPAVNKYLITAYAPCMEVPVHDDVYTACQKQNVPGPQCQCLAQGIGKYTTSESVRLLSSVLSKYPNAFDPIAAIKQTPEFESNLDRIAKQCAGSQ